MSGLKHTIAVLISIFAAYIWLSIPQLSYYSLQAFALSAFGFFVVKRLSKEAQIWHILPKTHSIEIIFISFAIIILVGSTGNAESIFYPFSYVHLFFLVMTARQSTATVATMATMLTHYALEPVITTSSIATLITLPLMLVFFLFARRQYDDARLQHKLIAAETNALDDITQKEHSLESFIANFIQPKLTVIQDILETAIHRNETIDPQLMHTQITIVTSESQKILKKIQSTNETDTQ